MRFFNLKGIGKPSPSCQQVDKERIGPIGSLVDMEVVFRSWIVAELNEYNGTGAQTKGVDGETCVTFPG